MGARGSVLLGTLALAALAALPAATAARADDDAPFDPWRSLRKGDWVKLRSQQKDDLVVEQVWRVTEATPDKVVYQVESTTIRAGGRRGKVNVSNPEIVPLEGEGAVPPPAASSDPGAPERKKVTLEIAGRTLECTLMELTTKVAGRDVVTRVWSCPDVPFGIVKVETDGRVTQELVEFGRE